jgi:hypothetical protein
MKAYQLASRPPINKPKAPLSALDIRTRGRALKFVETEIGRELTSKELQNLDASHEAGMDEITIWTIAFAQLEHHKAP